MDPKTAPKMETMVIYGPALSSYVWSASLACSEKGLPFERREIEFHSPEHYRINPYGRVPILEHGATRIFETDAILRYLEDVAHDPPLIPDSAVERAAVNTWMSVMSCHTYRHAIPGLVLQYVFPSGPDGSPDRDAIEASANELDRQLTPLDAHLAGRIFIAGDQFTAADVLWAPVLAALARFPEGKALLDKHTNVARLLGRIADRDSFRTTAPPAP